MNIYQSFEKRTTVRDNMREEVERVFMEGTNLNDCYNVIREKYGRLLTEEFRNDPYNPKNKHLAGKLERMNLFTQNGDMNSPTSDGVKTLDKIIPKKKQVRSPPPCLDIHENKKRRASVQENLSINVVISSPNQCRYHNEQSPRQENVFFGMPSHLGTITLDTISYSNTVAEDAAHPSCTNMIYILRATNQDWIDVNESESLKLMATFNFMDNWFIKIMDMLISCMNDDDRQRGRSRWEHIGKKLLATKIPSHTLAIQNVPLFQQTKVNERNSKMLDISNILDR